MKKVNLKSIQITSLFGEDIDEDAVQHLFRQLNTLNRPSLDPIDDIEVRYFDWVLVKRKGVELGFTDFYYHYTADFDLWGLGDLLLTQVYFYSAKGTEDTLPFTGELPYNLTFDDTQGVARDKLESFEYNRHSFLSDTWDVEGYRLNVQYTPEGTIGCVICLLIPPPLKQDVHLSNPALSTIIEKLGQSPFDVQFIQLWQDDNEFTLEQENEIKIYRRLNLKQTLGVSLLFTGLQHAALFKSIIFYSDREEGAIQWNGELPFGITFSDDMLALLKKINGVLIDSIDLKDISRRVWNLPEYTLFILYSNVENRIMQLEIIAKGYWSQS
ncbi:Uncharacterised protein [Pragia fontium]|uniref:hypothetical protein n=1 Tax=Pragia fontium TaxID=82985 RepID=UPI000E02F7DF|nr:hypothetical protein [Pragia fontium]SUB81860.1 Uncharacterised protein [Pragia fontium]